MNYHTELALEAPLEIVSDLILQHKKRELNKPEIAILEGVWKGQTYEEIAEEDKIYYCAGHLHEVGSKLWRDLSEALGKKVNKSNVRFTIEQKLSRDTQSNLSRCQTQLKDCFVDFLLVTRNTYAESVRNIDSSYNLLVKDSANTLWQKPYEVGHKLTPENWRAVCQPKFELGIKLNDEIVVQVIDSLIYLCTGKYLTYLEIEVVCGIWNQENYENIANKIKRSRCKNRKLCGSNCQCKYSPNYLRKNIASDLWSKLSKAFFFLDYEINKVNFKSTLEQWHEKMRTSFTYNY